MRFSKQIFAVSLFLTFSSLVNAGVLLEPYIGYEFAKNAVSKVTYVVGSDAGGTTNGSTYGLRLGYKLPVLAWVALDASMGTGKFKPDNVFDFTDDQTSDRTVLGVTAGIDLPIFLRVWAGYGFSDQMSLKDSAGTKDTFKGTNTKIGIGLGFIPFVSVNIEYIMRKYTDGTLATGETFSSVYSKAEQTSTMISISAPFNF
jgi:hypothetical protein